MNEEDIILPQEDETPEQAPQALFTVKTVLNATMQNEASLALTPKINAIVSYICFAVTGIMGAILVWRYFAGGGTQNLIMAALVAALLVYLIYSRRTTPKKALVRWENQMIRSFGTAELHLTAEFFEHSLAQSVEEDESNVTVVGYSELNEYKETEHLLLVHNKGSHWFFLDREGVQGGSIEELKKFLDGKMGG